MNVSFALNQGDFASRYHIASQPKWTVQLRTVKP
jgi:S-adenosylmethionine hydrolase